jgi:hypothetical protein
LGAGFESSKQRTMKSNEGARIHVAAQRRGLKAKIRGDTVAFMMAKSACLPGGAEAARAFLAKQAMTEKARREIARLKRKREPSRRIKRNDPGLESEDLTPANAKGLIGAEVELPAWLSADAALIALWRAEWRGIGRAKLATLAEARREITGPCVVRRIVLSDADRASLAAHAGTPAEVFVRAALARGEMRSR